MRSTITAREAAEVLGMSYWKLLQLVKAGEIPHIRVGGRILFRRATLDDWLEHLEQASVARQPEPGKIRRLEPRGK